MADTIEAGLLDEQAEEVLKWGAASMYAGGSDTARINPITFFTGLFLLYLRQKVIFWGPTEGQ